MTQFAVNTRVVATSETAQTATLERIARLAQLSTASDSTLICVFDEIRCGAGLFDELTSAELELLLALATRPVSHREILAIADVPAALRGRPNYNAAKCASIGSFVGAPIWVSGVRIGTLVAVSEQMHHLDAYEETMLKDLADLAADQIESARALEESERKRQRAQRVFQKISDGIITVNEFGHIKRINHAAERIFGCDAASIRGERISLSAEFGLALHHVPDGPSPMPPDFRSLLGKSHTMPGWNKNGQTLALEVSVAQVALQEENAFVLTVRDVTELREIQLLLKQHAFIVEKTESAVLITDSKGRIEWCNGGFEAASGYILADICGEMPAQLLWDADNAAGVIETVTEAIDSKRSYNAEMIWRRSNGQPYWMAVEAHPICDQHGELLKYVSLGFDITERKRSAKMKTDFVSMVSHELRTPLTVIAGTLEAMIDGIAGPMPPLADELLIMGKRNCTSLATLIDDLLDVNQLESGVVKLNSRQFSVSQLIVEVYESMANIAEENGIQLKVLPNPEQYVAFSDPDRLNQVLTNLLGNALKFSPVDTTVCLAYEQRGDHVRVSVTDQGPGISHEFAPKLFQMFSRDPAVEASGKEGFGLGLCISKGLMDRMGGTIGFESPAQGGATFYFEIPLLGPYPPANAPVQEKSAQGLLSLSHT